MDLEGCERNAIYSIAYDISMTVTCHHLFCLTEYIHQLQLRLTTNKVP